MLGLPIIATNVGGNPEIIHNNKTGLLVPSKNASALRDSMKKLYEDASSGLAYLRQLDNSIWIYSYFTT